MRVWRWRLAARNQPHARESALAELQEMLASCFQQQVARFADIAVDAPRTLAELSHRFRCAGREPRSLQKRTNSDAFGRNSDLRDRDVLRHPAALYDFVPVLDRALGRRSAVEARRQLARELHLEIARIRAPV